MTRTGNNHPIPVSNRLLRSVKLSSDRICIEGPSLKDPWLFKGHIAPETSRQQDTQREAQRQTEKEKEKEKERERDRDRHSQTQTETDTERGDKQRRTEPERQTDRDKRTNRHKRRGTVYLHCSLTPRIQDFMTQGQEAQ